MDFLFLDTKSVDKALRKYKPNENVVFSRENNSDDLSEIFRFIKDSLHKEKELFSFEVKENDTYLAFCVISTEGEVKLLCLRDNKRLQELIEFIFSHIIQIFKVKNIKEITIKVQQNCLKELNEFGFKNVRAIIPEFAEAYSTYCYLLRYTFE